MFSRIGRFAYRSSRDALNKGAISGSYWVRSAGFAEISSGNGKGFAACENSRLGLLRSYLTSAGAGAGKQTAKLHHLKELDSTFANPRLRRLFSNQAPQKKESEAGVTFTALSMIFVPLSLMFFVVPVSANNQPKQINFEEFKNKLLEPGLVDHIVVSNKSVAKVYVRSSPPNDNQTNAGDSNGRRFSHSYGFYINIGSVKSFEEELKEAQESLGVDPHHYVPVTNVSQTMSDQFYDALMKIPLAFVFGALWGRGFKDVRGIFNIGKAQIMKMVENFKHNS